MCRGWQRLYTANRKVVGDDPDLIFPGQRLTLDVADTPQTGPKSGTRPAAKPSRSSEPKQKTRPHQPAKPSHRTTSPHQVAKAQPKKTERAEKDSGLVAPVTATRVGTAYHQAGSWASGYHTGVDFPVPTGTSVKAVASGTVVSAYWAGAYGYEIVIRHSDGRYSQYAHLSALLVREGQHVGGGLPHRPIRLHGQCHRTAPAFRDPDGARLRLRRRSAVLPPGGRRQRLNGPMQLHGTAGRTVLR